jgi:hypothetical protein
MGAFAAATALLLAWNVFAGGRIAQMRNAPKELDLFRALSGLGGFLVIPAMLIGMAEQSELTGHALTMLAWLWPAVLALFAIQASLALGLNLVPTVIGVPLLLYDLTQLLIASTRVAAAHGLTIPVFFLAPGASQATLLSLLLGASTIGSPLAIAVPLLAPAGPARWRPSVMFRSALAMYAVAVVVLIGMRFFSAYASIESLVALGGERLTERATSGFDVGLHILPTVTGAPGSSELIKDFAMTDSLGVGALELRIAPEGCSAAVLDSLARALEPYRRDSVLLIVALAAPQGSAGELRDAPTRYLDRRADAVDRIVRRLHPDYIIPAGVPFGAEAEAIGVQSESWWEEYYTRMAAIVRRDRPATRTLVAVAATRDSALYAWAAANTSPVDGVAFILAPAAGGHTALAVLANADRWMSGVAQTDRTHWIIASSAPAITGEEAQRRLLHHVLAWATAHSSVRGVVLGDAADYDRVTGFRSATGRLRPIVADVAAAIRVLFETPALVTP